jgi:hypothetical protein
MVYTRWNDTPSHVSDRPTVSLGDAVVSAVIPSRRRVIARTPGLPVAQLTVPERDESAHYVVTAIDAHGRLADRSAVRVLRWQPGQPIAITITQRALLILPQPNGPEFITQQGHLRVPAAVRHAFGIKSSDRMLLAAFPDRSLLVAYTFAALDTMILLYHRACSTSTQP